MRNLFITVVLLTTLTGCWKYNIANLGKYTAEHETWSKKGISTVLGIRKALLECGKVSLGGVTKDEYEKVGILEQKDQYNHEFLVDRCMINAGFIEQNTSWTLKDACSDSRYRDYPACQPNAVIFTPSVERRLNSWYCKVKTDYDYCLKYAIAPQLCTPEKTKNPPLECLADGQTQYPASSAGAFAQSQQQRNTYTQSDRSQEQANQLQRDTQNQNNQRMNEMLKNTSPKIKR